MSGWICAECLSMSLNEYDTCANCGSSKPVPPSVAVPEQAEAIQAKTVIANLLNGIKRWAAEEDGIPENMWADFCAGMSFLNWEYTGDADSEALGGLYLAAQNTGVMTATSPAPSQTESWPGWEEAKAIFTRRQATGQIRIDIRDALYICEEAQRKAK